MACVLAIDDADVFRARVIDGTRTLYLIDGDDLITHGPMRHRKDVDGLARWLRKRKVIGADDVIVCERRSNRREEAERVIERVIARGE